MNIVYISWNDAGWLTDGVKLAVERGGWPVVVVSPLNHGHGTHYHPCNFGAAAWALKTFTPIVGSFQAFSIARWFALKEMIQRGMVMPPVFTADWDFLIFRNLNECYQPFAECDVAVSDIGERGSTAPYFINRTAPLWAFCEHVEKNDMHGCNDMSLWAQVVSERMFKRANTYEIHDGSVFDHHIADDNFGTYEMEPDGSKKISWVDSSPYFHLKAGGTVRANSIHCWGQYKNKAEGLAAKACQNH